MSHADRTNHAIEGRKTPMPPASGGEVAPASPGVLAPGEHRSRCGWVPAGLTALWVRIRGRVNLLLGRAVNEDPRRRATTMGWDDDDPSLLG